MKGIELGRAKTTSSEYVGGKVREILKLGCKRAQFLIDCFESAVLVVLMWSDIPLPSTGFVKQKPLV